YSSLILVFSFFIGIRNFTHVRGLEKNQLCDTFVGVNFRGQWSRVRNFDGEVSTPFWLKRRDIHDDTTPWVSGFANAESENVPGYSEILCTDCERKAIRRNDAIFFRINRNEGIVSKILRVNNGVVDVGENFEFAANSNVVTVGRQTEADCFFRDNPARRLSDYFPYLVVVKRIYHRAGATTDTTL